MKLYLVRLIETKEAVGLFWSRGGDDLWWEVDEAVVEPGACEWAAVSGNAAVIWPKRVAGLLGVLFHEDVGFSMDGAEVDAALGQYTDGLVPIKWKPFAPADVVFARTRGVSA